MKKVIILGAHRFDFQFLMPFSTCYFSIFPIQNAGKLAVLTSERANALKIARYLLGRICDKCAILRKRNGCAITIRYRICLPSFLLEEGVQIGRQGGWQMLDFDAVFFYLIQKPRKMVLDREGRPGAGERLSTRYSIPNSRQYSRLPPLLPSSLTT